MKKLILFCLISFSLCGKDFDPEEFSYLVRKYKPNIVINGHDFVLLDIEHDSNCACRYDYIDDEEEE